MPAPPEVVGQFPQAADDRGAVRSRAVKLCRWAWWTWWPPARGSGVLLPRGHAAKPRWQFVQGQA